MSSVSTTQIIEKIEVPGLYERFEDYKKVKLAGAVAVSLIMGVETLMMASVIYFPKYFDLVFYAGFAVLGISIIYPSILIHKMQKNSREWKLVSTKMEIQYTFLPLVLGMLGMAIVAYWIIAQIAGWGISLYLLFVLIFSIPLIFVIALLIFMQDTYTLHKRFSTAPENLIDDLERMLNCSMKKSFWFGYWTGNYKGLDIKIVPISTLKTKEARMILKKVMDKNLKSVKEVISLLR
ncbi:MAG: hypothetical protein GXO25_06610 [Euryarchaeota archaeon]|nr:hypothetical protein [Euryarchaeota archaeon]